MDNKQEINGNCPVVIDNGSTNLKGGFAGNEFPTIITPTIFGKKQDENLFYIGDEAFKKRDILNLQYPIQSGIITNWDDMEKIWKHCFHYDLKISPEEHPFLLTEPILNPKINREKMTQIMFEKFNMPAIYFSIQQNLSLYQTGRTTGLVLEIGDSVSHTVPVYEGYSIPNAVKILDFAGQELTEFLMKNLNENGYSFTSSAEREIARDIKEIVCYVSLNFDQEIESVSEKTYVMPDGKSIKIGKERIKVTEALFQPKMIGIDSIGIHEATLDTIQHKRIDYFLQKDLFQNIVLAGGSTLFEGFEKRLQNDIENLAKDNKKVKVIASPERKYSAWLGGSILASLSTFQSMWISKDEYDESGPSIVHRRC